MVPFQICLDIFGIIVLTESFLICNEINQKKEKHMIINHPLPPPQKPQQTVISQLGYLSTEKTNPLTANLSQVMRRNCIEGLDLLAQADERALDGFEYFSQKYLPDLKLLVQNTLAKNGRCFLVGCGSSGRVALDIAAKCASKNIIGIIAGGDSTFIRAKEGCEDSYDAGKDVAEKYGITNVDLVFPISASGSATFNVGCADQARKAGATVCYFFNSEQVPECTKQLFNNGVIPILVDIGPQAITGSTRLQAASLAELSLGCLLLKEEPSKLLAALKQGNCEIKNRFEQIAKIIQLEHEVLADPQANFRRLRDETNQGYVTLITDEDTVRPAVIDAVELPPTFCTNRVCTITETEKKKPEFQAFLVGNHSILEAWNALVGRNVNGDDQNDVALFEINESALAKRPIGVGNIVIGVVKENPSHVLSLLRTCKQKGAKTALIQVTDKPADTTAVHELDASVHICVPGADHSGLVLTVLLKQLLNMVSNSTMILMNKVDGNQMIDVNASNNKLKDRAVRLVEFVFNRYNQPLAMHYETLYGLIIDICARKKEYQEKNIYTPAPVKMAVTMIHRKLNFDQAREFLYEHQENIEKVFSGCS